MPTYGFECSKCGKTEEVFLHFDDPQPVKCKCGGKLKKVFYPVGIVFKGSGFYCTDHKGGNGTKKVIAGEKEGKGEKEKKTEKKEETTVKAASDDSKKSTDKSKETAKK